MVEVVGERVMVMVKMWVVYVVYGVVMQQIVMIDRLRPFVHCAVVFCFCFRFLVLWSCLKVELHLFD